MALIHGWPLNGDLQDKGTHSTPLLGGPTSYSDDGKIGKCLSGNTVYMPASETVLSLKDKNETICFGFNNGGISESNAICGTNGNNDGTDKDPMVSRTGDFFTYPTKNDFHGWMGAMGTGVLRGVFKDNTWHHIAVVLDSSNGHVYIDGVKKTTFNRDPNGATPNFNQDFHIKNSPTSHKINDFRIYDEPLSAKEVKKISQGLILHYNPDYVCGYNLLNSYDMYTKDNPFTSNRADQDGYSSLPIGCDVVNGKIYTLSADMDGTVVDAHGHNEGVDKKSCSIGLFFRDQTGAEGAYGTFKIPVCYTRASSNFRRISKTRYAWTLTAPTDTTIKSCSIRVNTYSDGTHPVLVHFGNFKLEEGEVATPFSLIRSGQALDSSGFCHDGTIVSEAIEKSTDHRYKKNIVADGNPEHYIQSDINPSFLTSGVTFNVGYKNINKSHFLIACGQTADYYVMAMNDTGKGCGIGMSGEQIYYIDGQPRTVGDGYPKDGQGHMYTFVGTNIGTGTALYGGHHPAASWNYNGPLGDIRLYATALSAADVKALYNETRVTRPMQFLISNSSALASLTSSNPVLADGELVVVRSTDAAGKTYFNIRKGNGVNNFNSLPGKQVSEAILKGGRSSFVSDAGSLVADKGSYSNLGGGGLSYLGPGDSKSRTFLRSQFDPLKIYELVFFNRKSDGTKGSKIKISSPQGLIYRGSIPDKTTNEMQYIRFTVPSDLLSNETMGKIGIFIDQQGGNSYEDFDKSIIGIREVIN